jgi:SAM-dependent methyltransferase
MQQMTDGDAIRKTREWWDQRAETEDALPDVVGVGRYDLEPATEQYLANVVVDMLSSARTKGVCLDGGCGVGLAFPIIDRVFPTIIGLDFSPNVIRRIPPEFGDHKSAQLCNGSITAIPLADASVDAVHCRDLMQCLPSTEVKRTFEEFRRVLKPGGVAVVHFKNSASMWDRLARVLSRVKRLGRAPAPPPSPLTEVYVPGDTYLRPWQWCVEQARAAGLKVERQYSWQLFFWGRLEARGLARPFERWERRMRKVPVLESIIRHNGINYWILLRKTD